MKRIEAKADLGVPVSDIRPDNETLHVELARANLLRLRGDFSEAEVICVKVLEAQPESAAAHTLLGDIALAQDRPDQATEHYDIAQSLDPFAPDITRKLADARALKDARDTATTADQLGLPSRKPVPWHIGLIGVGAAFLVLTAVILIARTQKGPANAAYSEPTIQATADTIASRPKTKSSVTGAAGAAATTAPTEGNPSLPAMTAGGTIADRALWESISQQNPMGAHLLSLSQDPRAKNVVVSYFVSSGEDPRRVGAELAKATLERAGDALGVTLRALRDDQLIYMADVSRARYDETLSDAWQRANPGEDAWIAFCMTNEWPYQSTVGGAPSGATASGTAGSTTAGSGDGAETGSAPSNPRTP